MFLFINKIFISIINIIILKSKNVALKLKPSLIVNVLINIQLNNVQKNNLPKINNDGDDENNKNEEKKNIEDEEVLDLNDSNEINKKKQIRKLKEIKEDCEHENKLMKGYQSLSESEEFEENVNRKLPNFASPITVYKKEIEMFKKVNPIEYEKELRKKLNDDKMLMKKLQNRKIYERIKIKK